MTSRHLCKYLLIALLFVLFNSCSNEEHLLVSEESKEITDAKKFLYSYPTIMPYAILEMDHYTHRIDGYFIDKTSKIRRIGVNNATPLRLEVPSISEHFLTSLYNSSTIQKEISPVDLSEILKKLANIEAHDPGKYKSGDGTKSKIYLSFKVNIDHIDPRDCGSGTPDTGPTFLKVLLGAEGQYNYESSIVAEIANLEYLKALEASL